MQPQYQRQIGTCTHMYIGQVGEACAFDLDSLHWQPGLRFWFNFELVFFLIFIFIFAWTQSRGPMDSQVLLQARKIYFPSVCVIHFGLCLMPDADGCWLVVPFRHSLNFKRANAQNRIKCAKCREQTGKSGSSDVWMVGWLAGCAMRCGNNAEMPASLTNLASVISQLSRRQNWADGLNRTKLIDSQLLVH